MVWASAGVAPSTTSTTPTPAAAASLRAESMCQLTRPLGQWQGLHRLLGEGGRPDGGLLPGSDPLLDHTGRPPVGARVDGARWRQVETATVGERALGQLHAEGRLGN